MPFAGSGDRPTTDEAIGAMTATPSTPRYGIGNISDVIGAEGGSHEPGIANDIGAGVDQVRTVIGRVLGTLAGHEAGRAIRRQDQERTMMRDVAMGLAASGHLHEAPEFGKHLGKYMDKDAIENLSTLSMIAKSNPEVGQMLMGQMAPKAGEIAVKARGQDIQAGVAMRGQDITARGQDLKAATEDAKRVETTAHNRSDEDIRRAAVDAQRQRNDILGKSISNANIRAHEQNVTELQKSLFGAGLPAAQAQSIADKYANHEQLTPEEQLAVKTVAGKDPAVGLHTQNAKLSSDNRKIMDRLSGLGDPNSQINLNSATPDILKAYADNYNENLKVIAGNKIRTAKSDKEVVAIMNKLQDDIIGVGEEGGYFTSGVSSRKLIHIRDVPKFDNKKNPQASVLVNPGDYIDSAVQELAGVKRGDMSKVTGKSPAEEALEKMYLGDDDESAEATPDSEAAEE